MQFRQIQILETNPNKKGDLFGRLMGDLFHSLGYSDPRFNISKSGREIDLNCKHRIERKIAIAECKAHAEPIGGSDINKFIGAFDAEKTKLISELKDYNFVGYFISLSGFTETAVEQENELGNNRVILLKSEKIVEELINGRIVVSIEKAISSIPGTGNDNLLLVNYTDLLAYEKGWVWVIYYSNTGGQTVTHFTLVHAEGKLLINELVDEIISLDKNTSNILSNLSYIQQIQLPKTNLKNIDLTKKKYYKYIENELGEIQFEGLPTDKDSGAVKVKLENIFVPMHLTQTNNTIKGKAESKELEGESITGNRQGIGEILQTTTRLAILAKPGAGKSTLIKRIAIAYAFPSRRQEIQDKLPDKPWFPIFLRCRELGENVTLSITEIINKIPLRAEINSCTEEFSILASTSLQNGNALLLIDGLDEIAEDKNRISFVNQLRTFIATYPTINIIVTSREAGFRAVGGALATYCEHYRVSNLIETEIEELSIKWHKAIIDHTENTIKEAKKLSDLIIKDNRIKALAENPLLLTTLLFVRRWAGYLPTKKSVLYQEMIKLLLVTWNVEGHEQLDIEEAEPQLAFIAFWMTQSGQQTINADELNNSLIEARKQMPEILSFTNISPSEFIKRVESRSSLLIMSGHNRLNSGNLIQVYEFLHLSFQEYLTAKAVVKRFIPNNVEGKTSLAIIKDNIQNEHWKEVIPLIAVLLERGAKDVIEYLISETKNLAISNKKSHEENFAPVLLTNCIANEVQISPDLLNDAIEWLAKSMRTLYKETNEIILNNKFGQAYRKKIIGCYFEPFDDKFAPTLAWALADVYLIDLGTDNEIAIIDKVLYDLEYGDRKSKCISILALMEFSFHYVRGEKQSYNVSEAIKEKIFNILFDLLTMDDLHTHFAISWCIAWGCDAKLFPNALKQKYIDFLSKSWASMHDDLKMINLKKMTSWALINLLFPEAAKNKLNEIENIEKIVRENYKSNEINYNKLAAVFIGNIIGLNWDQNEIKIYLQSQYTSRDICKSENILNFGKVMGINKNELIPKNDINT